MQQQLQLPLALVILITAMPVMAQDKVISEPYPWPNAEYPSREKPMRRELGEPLEFGEKYPKSGAAGTKSVTKTPKAGKVITKPSKAVTKTPKRPAGARRPPPDAAGARRPPPDAAGARRPPPDAAARAPWWKPWSLIRPHVPAPHAAPSPPDRADRADRASRAPIRPHLPAPHARPADPSTPLGWWESFMLWLRTLWFYVWHT